MKDRIVEFIGEVNGMGSKMQAPDGNASLVNQLGINSLNLVSLVLLIEGEYGIEIDFESFSADHIRTLDNFVSFVTSHVPA
jgi:acyl carrier protein